MGDVLFVGSDSGNLHALNAVTGDALWNLGLNAPMSAAPAYADGNLYLLTETGILYAVE